MWCEAENIGGFNSFEIEQGCLFNLYDIEDYPHVEYIVV